MRRALMWLNVYGREAVRQKLKNRLKMHFLCFSWKFFENWRFWKFQFFWVGHFEFFFQKKRDFFCFFPIKISPNLHGRMDGSKFWCFPWFPENSLLCVIIRYTVYIVINISHPDSKGVWRITQKSGFLRFSPHTAWIWIWMAFWPGVTSDAFQVC